MSRGGNITTSDAVLKFIDEKGGRIKKEDIDMSHYTALGNLFVERLVRYEDKEIELTEDGKEYIKMKKKFYKKAYRNLKL